MLTENLKKYDCAFSKLSRVYSLQEYRLKCPTVNLDQSFRWNTQDDIEATLKNEVARLMSVLANGARFNESMTYDEEKMLTFIDNNFVKLAPNAKLDNILLYISERTNYDGQGVEMPTPHPAILAKMYFHNAIEWRFYLQNAISQGLVEKKAIGMPEPNAIQKHAYSLTIIGLSKLITVTESKSSRFAFIAMAFTDDMFQVAEEAIKPALITCGFNGLMVSDQHVDSDKTINDAILASIKKSRFTIADFTYHRGGVYFEAGYALGRGQKVIYTCREDHMGKAHFDIRNYQHIVWTNVSDFKVKLVNKIEAFIKD